MKNYLITAIITLSLLGVSSSGFAASYGKSGGASYLVIEGTIVSIDKTKNLFVIKDKDDGRTYGLSAFTSQIASLNQGDHVKVTVPLPGSLVSRITR